jgi:hypothetical protein
MATRRDTLIILPEAIPAADLLSTLRQRFAVMGVEPSSEPLVIFNDFGGAEREPEVVTSESDAIARLLSWPGLGGTDYELAGHGLSLFLFGTKAGHVDGLSLSVPSSAYLFDERLREAHDRLAADLHHSLNGKRTISGGNLLSPGSWWLSELERVRRNTFEGEYELDLR